MKDILDIHSHTIASGHAYNTLYEMARAAADNGMELFGSSDHGPALPGSSHEMYFCNFKSIPKALAEAARIDGANTWQTIWRVYMPCAKPAYMSFAVISVSYHWNNYLWPLIVTNSPSNRTLTVGLAIFAKSKEANMQWANVCAATFIIILPLLIAFFFLQKQFMNSFVSAGIKE